MKDLSTSEWLTIVGIVVAVFIGLFQLIKSNKSKTQKLNITQSSGTFSKGTQNINLKVDSNDD